VPEIDNVSGNATVGFDELKIKKTDWFRVTNLHMTVDFCQSTHLPDILIGGETDLTPLPDDHTRRGYISQNSFLFHEFNEEKENIPGIETHSIKRKVVITFHKYKFQIFINRLDCRWKICINLCIQILTTTQCLSRNKAQATVAVSFSSVTTTDSS
jgi:hypothetical protein